jgi:hypothetical protein
VILEPYRTVVLVPRSCDDARAFLRKGRAWSHEARGDSVTLSCWVMSSIPQGAWQHQSTFLVGGALGTSGHVATPEPFPGGWRAMCHGAHGGTGALSWQVACSVPRDTWRSQNSLAPVMGMEPWG